MMDGSEPSPDRPVAQALVGVYDAEGGVFGELRYTIGHILKTAECALCDITHSWRRKPEWDALVSRLPVPFEVRHLNQLDPDLAEAVERAGAPVVFARAGSSLTAVLTTSELQDCGGSVARFEDALRSHVAF